MFLQVLDAQLRLARPAQAVENEASLLPVLRLLSSRERRSQTLEVAIASCKYRAQKVRDFEVLVM